MSARERIHTGLEHSTGWIYDHAWLTIAAVLLCVGALATQLPNLRLEGRVEAFLHEDDPLRVAYDEFRHQFGRDDLILLTLESPDLFEARSLERLRALHEELDRSVPYLEEITSLVNARETRGEGDELIVGELLEDWPGSDAARAAVRGRALANRLYRGLLISEDAGLSVMVIELSRGEAGDDLDELLAGFDDPAPAPTNGDESAAGTTENTLALAVVSEIVAAHQAPDFRIHVTGTGAFTEYLQQAMRRDMSRFTALGVLTIAVLLALLFRSLAGVLLPLLVVLLSLVATLSLMAALDEPIAMPTQILPSFLLAVGVGGAVHLVAIFFQNQRAGLDKRASIVGAAGHSGLAIIMTSLTTAGAMASFATASLAPIAGLGLCAPGGVMVALAVTLVLLPALVAVFPVRGGATLDSGRSATQRALVRCGDFAIDHRGPVLVVSAALGIASLVGMGGLSFSHAPIRWFAEDNPFRVATELTDQRMGGSANLEILIDTGAPNGMHDPELLSRLDGLQTWLDEYETNGISVGKSISLADTIQEIHQALNENRPEYYRVPDDRRLVAQELLLFENAGSDDLEDVVDPQFRIGRVTLRVPFDDAIAYTPFLEAVATRFEQRLGEDVEVRFTGLLPIMSGTMRAMSRSMVVSYSIAFFVIGALLILLIGDLKLGLLALIPNVAPIVVVLGAMGYVGYGLDTFTMLIGSIAIGLAVDDTIHFMHNFKRNLDRSGEPRLAVSETLATAGQAMLFTSLVLSSGFAIYALSSMSVLVGFGLITAGAVALAFLADVLLAPALMTWVVEDGR